MDSKQVKAQNEEENVSKDINNNSYTISSHEKERN